MCGARKQSGKESTKLQKMSRVSENSSATANERKDHNGDSVEDHNQLNQEVHRIKLKAMVLQTNSKFLHGPSGF